MALYRSNFYAALCLAAAWMISTSCAGPDIQSEKAPEADLWMYHTYSWRPQGSPPTYSETEKLIRARTNQNLSDRGMILVPPAGNPDMWINESVTPQSLELSFTDAHTGSLIWEGRSLVKPGTEQFSESIVNTSVDHLVNQYIAEQKWMPASFWYTGINQVGS
jgi:hypothetical protein